MDFLNRHKPTSVDYCQYLISTQINYTITNYADHHAKFSHDAINRYLAGEKLTPRMVWEQVKGSIVTSPYGCLIFDDTVLDKNHSHHIEMVKLQYSGNAHGLIKGISVINCMYVNPESGQYWIVGYRIYDPDHDGKSKLDHMMEMLVALVAAKEISFDRVLMDSWYATKDVMLLIESLGKIYYCPLKSNRQVDDSDGVCKYRSIDSLQWSQESQERGKVIKIKGFPKAHKVKLFRVEISNNRTDYVVTNDLAQNSSDATQKTCGIRWKVEQFHRELKQTTGIEKCQCRKARIQRNHIACAMMVWVRLTELVRRTGTNIYQIKQGLLSNYLRAELENPSVRMVLVPGSA